MTIDSQEPPSTVSASTRRAILFEGCANGLGNVGHKPGVATYSLYNPDSDTVKFRNISYSTRKGFQP
jgi:hypothetical protein